MKGFPRNQLIALLEDPLFLGWRHFETRAEYEAQGERDEQPRASLYHSDLLVYQGMIMYTLLQFRDLFLEELLEEHDHEPPRGHCHVSLQEDDRSTVTVSFY